MLEELDEDARAFVEVEPPSDVIWLGTDGAVYRTQMNANVFEMPRVSCHDRAAAEAILAEFEADYGPPTRAVMWGDTAFGACISFAPKQIPSEIAVRGLLR